MQLIDFFDRSAALNPNTIFVKQGAVSRTYAESYCATHRIAAALLRDGFGPSTRVGIYMPNDWRGLEAMFGLWRAGCVMVPVNARNAAEQNAQILRDSKVEVIFYHSSFALEIEHVQSICVGLRLAICVDRDLDNWMAETDAKAPYFSPTPDDLWALYSTSGTTGKSKGVRHTHLSNLIASMDMLHALQVHGAVNHLVVAPMTHFAGSFLFALTITGSTHVLLDRTEPEIILAAIEDEQAQIIFLPPTIIYRLLASPALKNHDYSSLHRLAYGAAPMAPQKLREAIKNFGPVMTNFFGQAEGIGPICFLSPEDHRPEAGGVWEDRFTSIGKPSILRQVAVVDEDGTPQPPGMLGEVAMRSWGVMEGYENNPKATKEAFKNGWYLTGDIGVVDSCGYVTLVDRKKDVIISGGFNIYPAQVEQELLSHPEVQEAAVIGVPDPDWGEAVKAVIELRKGGVAGESDLIALCKKRLGSINAPKSVEFWEELPRNATGKVLKRQIREFYWKNMTRKI